MPIKRIMLLAVILFSSAALTAVAFTETPSENQLRGHLAKTFKDGNFKESYEGYRKLVLNPASDPGKVSEDLRMAVQCLRQLGRVKEVDALLEAAVETHAENWRLLWMAAQQYSQIEQYGHMVAGEFERGNRRGGGKVVNSTQRDRVRALQLLVAASDHLSTDVAGFQVSNFYLAFARTLLNNRGSSEAWRLQYLTGLDELPDYDDGWYYGRGGSGAAVDDEGDPVFHHVPESWEAAKTDGERWRWALMKAASSPKWADTAAWEFANFLHGQFGVQTMAARSPRFWRGSTTDDGDKDESGTYALDTLKENETIAKLATGVKRFDLPDEFNHLKIFQQLADKRGGSFGGQSLGTLAQIFENRRQYPRAAEYWRRSIDEYGAQKHKKLRLTQIVGDWGRFEPVSVQPKGQGASVEFRFRNARAVQFEAHEIKVAALLADMKDYLKSNPVQIDWNRINIGNIGHRMIQADQKKYVGRRVAAWDLELKPRESHFDRRITVTTPLSQPGAYLVTAKMAEGNTSKIVLWVSDTVIAKKQLSDGSYYFVADAVTGTPIAKANVEFLGYRQRRIGPKNRRVVVDTRNFAEFTDADGQMIVEEKSMPRDHTWIIIARTKGGRLAYLGFTGVWYNQNHDYQYNQTKVFTITDRPVYRPNQSVKFKFWVRNAKYDLADTSTYAGQTFRVELRNPKGDMVLEKDYTSDAFAGISGDYEIPSDAPLGVYSLVVKGRGGGSFRVEEYKKPEFEVTVDAPDEPVSLGEKITATINAKYYFGSPVTEAKVKYKVLRTSYTQNWYPVGPWDWLYGPGYWWFAPDYSWYPGWNQWGCRRPIGWWWHRPSPQPEVVSENEVEIGPDGTFDVEIDTAVAKEIHPDQDHRYQIIVEVTDRSRRTIVGNGTVMVARAPFQVFAWVDRGYYRIGDTVKASFKAHTLDHKPVTGIGKLDLFKITYDEQSEPVETLVRTWELATNQEGEAARQIKASAAGQYRLSYRVTDAAEHTIEGGYLFTVIGAGFDPSDYRFNSLELVAEKGEYRPGEKIRLLVNTDRVGSTVVLFVRPSNGVYLPPKILRLTGKSTIHEIGVVQKDMPNFFIEAFTVADAHIHAETKEIVVPPEKRVINVAVEPSAEEYRPGEEATVKVKLTDHSGEPITGSTVLSIYDKSVEYIAGGSNVASIKEFFWKWRRSHSPRTESNLLRQFGNLIPPGQLGMNNLGIFGNTVADERNKDGKLLGVSDRYRRLAGVDSPTPMAAASRVMSKSGDRLEILQSESADGAVAFNGGAFGNSAGDDGQRGQQPAAYVEATVRTKFADTAFWSGALETDADGMAEVSLTMPENLTAWKIKLWSMGHGTMVGEGAAEVVTRKNLLVRLQAPRFFVERDEVVLSANVHNYLPTKKTVQVTLETDGEVLTLPGDTVRVIEIEPNGEARVDWRVSVALEGVAVVRMKALTDEESDAIEMRFPAHVHGILKTESWAGVIRPDEERQAISIHVPSERRMDDSRLEIRYSPTLAGAMVDALPYLVEYPYGCTEQTLSRFLPTVITQKILLEMNLDLKAIQEKRTNLNAQEIGDDRERAKGWRRYDRNPVFDEVEVVRMVKDGVEALVDMQLSDGGWGWFSGYGERSSAHTTAYVVHGLQIARQNDVALVPGVLERGVEWLARYRSEQVQRLKNAATKKKPYKLSADNLDAFVYMVLTDADVADDAMRDFLYRDRTKMAIYAKAMFGLALEQQGDKQMLAMIVRNIEQFLVHDAENQTSYLDLPSSNYWWHWYGSEYEAHAYYLKLLCRTDPKGETAAGLVKYLLNNRKHASYWNSTRDTAICIEAMADFLRASGESRPDLVVEIWIDGKKQKEVAITAENLFTFDNKLVLEGDAVTTGVHEIELRRRGTGPVYFNAYLTNFTLEDHITRAGLELKVERKYYRLREVDKKIKVAGSRGQAVDQKVEKYEREPIPNLATLKSGDLVEIELVIESKNDYEYLIFEDMKAAGFEPVDVRSGYTGNELGAYVEFRDDRVSFFVSRLARGRHSVSYRVRAEIPGRFSALPTLASAMYAPELKANSDEIKVVIED